MQSAKLVIACVLAMLLAACGTLPRGSVRGSESGLKAPDFVVRGKTIHDQQWIDETVEGGVAGLGWKRPVGRPAEWDKPLARAPTAAPGVSEPAQTQPPKKKRFRDRVKARWLKMLRKEPEGG